MSSPKRKYDGLVHALAACPFSHFNRRLRKAEPLLIRSWCGKTTGSVRQFHNPGPRRSLLLPELTYLEHGRFNRTLEELET